MFIFMKKREFFLLKNKSPLGDENKNIGNPAEI